MVDQQGSGQGQVIVPVATPTTGAVLGGLLGALLAAPAAAKGIPPEVTVPALTGIATWFAHFLHTKLGTPE